MLEKPPQQRSSSNLRPSSRESIVENVVREIRPIRSDRRIAAGAVLLHCGVECAAPRESNSGPRGAASTRI